MKNKLVLILLLAFWAIAFYVAGIATSRADLLTDTAISPAYHFMPQNINHNIIHGNRSNSSIDKFDKCKNPGTVRQIRIEKSEKKMYLEDVNNCIVKQYDVRLGVEGTKHCEGDMKTPTGMYKIVEKRNSKYVKFLALDYPRAKDIVKARELKCKPGDSIGIHAWIEGLPKENSQGCITVWTKEEILEINSLVSVGTQVIIND